MDAMRAAMITPPRDENPHAEMHTEKRAFDRVSGPFEGRWISAFTLPVHIHDLSVGGCLIASHHERAAGSRLTLEIELPFEGWLRLDAETVYSRQDYGFAVKFVDVPGDTQTRLRRVVERLKPQQPVVDRKSREDC
jgi:hypothetical protein